MKMCKIFQVGEKFYSLREPLPEHPPLVPQSPRLPEERQECNEKAATEEHVWKEDVVDAEGLQFGLVGYLLGEQVFCPEKYLNS